MTEEEQIELAQRLVDHEEDVMVIEVNRADPGRLHFIAVDEDRIVHVTLGWGDDGTVATVACYSGGVEAPELVTEPLSFATSGHTLIINPK